MITIFSVYLEENFHKNHKDESSKISVDMEKNVMSFKKKFEDGKTFSVPLFTKPNCNKKTTKMRRYL